MSDAYNDCFGSYEPEPDDDLEEREMFRHHVNENAVEKICVGCGRKVKLLPHYDVCDGCADLREQGADF